MSARSPSRVALMSISPMCGTSCPVAVSSRMVGDCGVTDIARWFSSGSPVAVAPGSIVSTVCPGEKPSDLVDGFGLVGFMRCGGKVCGPNCACLPVGVLASSTSHTFDGKGKPHCSGTSGSHPVVASVSVEELQPTEANTQ